MISFSSERSNNAPLLLETTGPRPGRRWPEPGAVTDRSCQWAEPGAFAGRNCRWAAPGAFATPPSDSWMLLAVGTRPSRVTGPRGRSPGSAPVRRRHSGSRWAPCSSQLGHSQPHRPTKGSYDRSASASSAGIGLGLLSCTAASCTAVHSNVCNGFFSRSVEK